MAIKSFEIEGLDEIIKAFSKLGDDAIPRIEKASIDGAEKVLHKSKQKIEKHYKTGDAFHSLKVLKPTKSNKAKYIIFSKVTFGKQGAHIVPLELGHKLVRNGKQVGTVKERPILRPAADESKNEVIEIAVDAINKALDEMGGHK